jgi:hypothetical protein
MKESQQDARYFDGRYYSSGRNTTMVMMVTRTTFPTLSAHGVQTTTSFSGDDGKSRETKPSFEGRKRTNSDVNEE